jgi:hypothetical protein
VQRGAAWREDLVGCTATRARKFAVSLLFQG